MSKENNQNHIWNIGGMVNGKEPVRTVDIPLDFLAPGFNYEMTAFEDGINAGRQAMDYRRNVSFVKANDKITLNMVRNGGFAARLVKK